MLVAIWLAKVINTELGGAFVGPWDIGDLPDEWIDAIVGMATVVPRMAESKGKVEAALEAIRKKNKWYSRK